MILIKSDNGKKTDPKYAIRFANNASGYTVEMDKLKYPTLTTKIDENINRNQTDLDLMVEQ